MNRWLSMALATLIAWPLVAAPAPKSRITIVASLHGLHAKSAGYSYSRLYLLVKCLKPDYVGVEIRQEDLSRSRSYLEANYPREMMALADEWSSQVFGFDWLGDDVANAPIPPDGWSKRSPIKKLERALDGDARYKDPELASITAREKTILNNATPGKINSSLYDDLNDSYYARFAYLLAGSPYEEVPEFYARRDYRLALDVASFLKRHEGSHVVVVTGADHRSSLERLLGKWFGGSLQIVPIGACDECSATSTTPVRHRASVEAPISIAYRKIFRRIEVMVGASGRKRSSTSRRAGVIRAGAPQKST
jgi:hypothetical protein